MRSSKFSKYLPFYKWTPWIVTVHSRYYGSRVVPTTQDDHKPNKINRIPYLFFPGNVFLIKILFPFLILIFVLIKRKKIDAIYMSGSPYHPFILTTIFSGILRIPTVLDFRDSWSLNDGFDGRTSSSFLARIRRKIYGAIEKISIKFASRVIFTTSVLQNEYENAFPLFKEKYETIPNGFDPEDFEHIVPKRIYSGKTIILTGKFHAYTPEAVKEIMHCLQGLGDLHFVYVGDECEIIRDAAMMAKVEDRVTALPYQPYAEVLRLIAGADVGLMTNGMKNGLGTKIFDYLALGKPTVCLVPPSSVISREFGHSPDVFISTAPHKNEQIKEILIKAFQRIGRFRPDQLVNGSPLQF